jgi:hypothetical protein
MENFNEWLCVHGEVINNCEYCIQASLDAEQSEND